MEREEFFKQSCEVMLNLKETHDVLFFVHGESHHLTLDLHVDYDEIISASTYRIDHEEQLAKIRMIVGLEPKKEGVCPPPIINQLNIFIMSKYCDFVDAFHELDCSEQRQFISDHLDYAKIKDILEYLEGIGYNVS